MRMHMLPIEIMCARHRAGEHNEIHKHLPHLLAGKEIRGRYYHKDGRKRFSPQIELAWLCSRHLELAASFKNHRSFLGHGVGIIPQILELNYPAFYWVRINRRYSFWRLWLTCPDCRRLMGKHWRVSRQVLGID